MFALMAVTACVVGSPQRKKISVKAPSPFENYGCQCDNYTWQDTYGKIQVWDIALIVTRTAIHLWWCHVFFREIARALTQPVVGGVMSDLAILAMTYNTPRIEEIVMVS